TRDSRTLVWFSVFKNGRKKSTTTSNTMTQNLTLRPSRLAGVLGLLLVPMMAAAEAPELLFRVSADHGFVADHAQGDPMPNFQDKVNLVDDGVHGRAIQWQDDGVLSWNAPGNIQAARGTLSFFWR